MTTAARTPHGLYKTIATPATITTPFHSPRNSSTTATGSFTEDRTPPTATVATPVALPIASVTHKPLTSGGRAVHHKHHKRDKAKHHKKNHKRHGARHHHKHHRATHHHHHTS